MNKPICVRCNKKISGKISVDTYRRKLGTKSVHVVDYYCYTCFKKRSKEKSWNAYRKKKAADKRKNNS